MTQSQLIKRMHKMGFTGVNATHISNFINGSDKEMRYTLIRKIEIALDLPEFSLIKMAGSPTKAQWEKIKRIGVKKK